MNILVVGVAIASIVFIGIVLIDRRRQRLSKQHQQEKHSKAVNGDDLPIWPFDPMPIMTDTEVLFFKKLQQAMPDYLIFGQVQLSRIIAPSDAADSKSFWLNRICRQSVDYVLVGADLQTTLLAIELDDWTHNAEQRMKADAKKNKALASAGIPVLRFHAEKMPSVAQIRHDIHTLLDKYPRG